MGSSLIFPAPKCTYTSISLQPFYLSIPIRDEHYSIRSGVVKALKRSIPTLYITAGTKSKYLMIYFHGNCEDLGRSYLQMLEYYEHFQIDILAPEYPGYGIYEGRASASKMNEDSQHVLDYATGSGGLNYSIENVILVGRSLGTGVAIQLATKNSALRGLITISAYTSIRDVAYNVAGSISKILIPDVFRNIKIIKELTVPILFIHGEKDKIIPHIHSKELFDQCISSKKRMELRSSMDHNRCKFEKDILEPIELFLTEDLQIADLRSKILSPGDNSDSEDEPCAIKKRAAIRFVKFSSTKGLRENRTSLPSFKLFESLGIKSMSSSIR